uniref:Uncharacterized protein n=1 Tax=Rangifer tarandus platyrhynchus TaxID=3082113 RepID=A0ACB0F5Z6_RANTA|nr:unnamed protein product [Rangifer tarandus platyrhynchus]
MRRVATPLRPPAAHSWGFLRSCPRGLAGWLAGGLAIGCCQEPTNGPEVRPGEAKAWCNEPHSGNSLPPQFAEENRGGGKRGEAGLPSCPGEGRGLRS